MNNKININDIYDKNINFLFGSGASVGLFPTLALNVKGDDAEETQTIETLATRFENNRESPLFTLLFMHYYKKCIEPAINFDMESAKEDDEKKKIISNYEKFIDTLLTILQRRKNYEKNCNIFTTNYDGCFTNVADKLLKKGNVDFIINDGARGFGQRYLQAKNFNSYVYQTGVFERHRTDIPQINMIHVHGSVYWYKDGGNIRVDYSNNDNRLITSDIFKKLQGFSEVLTDDTKTVNDIPENVLTDEERESFWGEYNQLPIVNPTKWKFHETVFEEHYYQMLRLLSYELEKPNSIFITFGFSFADEHILNLVRRSLSNPSLQLFICCFSEAGCEKMKSLFKLYKNVEYITVEDGLDFTAFNEKIFNLDQVSNEQDTPEEGIAGDN